MLDFHVDLIDVDPFFIHYTAYTHWMDRGFMQLLREAGHPLHEIVGEGYGFPLVRCELEFRRPAHLDDHLRLVTEVKRLGRTSLTLGYEFYRLDDQRAPVEHLVHAESVHVCVDMASKRPRDLPPWLVQLGRSIEDGPQPGD